MELEGLVVRALALLVACAVDFGQAVSYINTNSGLTAVPVADMLATIGTIDDVSLENNLIPFLGPSEFDPFPSVATIDMSSNLLTWVDPAAFCATPLRTLGLLGNQLTAVPDLSCVASTLTTLVLNDNQICEISPSNFTGLSTLRHLHLSMNCLSSFEGLSEIRSTIVRIYMHTNDLRVIDSTFQNFSSLDTLQLLNNKLEHVAAGAFSGSVCRELDLSYNRLTAFPDVSPLGASLIRLILSHNDIRNNISEHAFGSLPGLFHLEMDYNNITMFPDALCSPTSGLTMSLRRLILHDNLMTQVGRINCSRLREIQLHNNPITEFPDIGGPHDLINTIRLDGTAIRLVLNSSYEYLPNVDKLMLSDSGLTDYSVLSALVEHMATLSQLVLSYNQLTDISLDVFTIPNLRILKLEYNAIACVTEFPENTSLMSVYLEGNPLQCDCCNNWMYEYSGPINILLDPEPCHAPSYMIGLTWADVITDIQTNGCTRSTEPQSTTESITTSHPTTTTEALTTMENPTTTIEATSTENPTTTIEATSTENPTTTIEAISTENPTTTIEATSTENPTTTIEATSTENPTTTIEATSTENPTTTIEATSTENPTTQREPTTIQRERTTTEREPTTTEREVTTTHIEPTTTQVDPTTTETDPTTTTRDVQTTMGSDSTTEPVITSTATLLTTEETSISTGELVSTATTLIAEPNTTSIDPTTTTMDVATTVIHLITKTSDPVEIATDSPVTTRAETVSTSTTAETSVVPSMSIHGEAVTEVLTPGPVDPVSLPLPALRLSWNAWIPWTDCTLHCGGGIQLRWMLCDSIDVCKTTGSRQSLNGSNFVYAVEARQCLTNPCPVDGYWQLWGAWGLCTAICGPGLRSRLRTCVQPRYGGQACDGKGAQHEICEVEACSEEEQKKRQAELRSWPVFTESDRIPSNRNIGIFAIIFSAMIVILLVIIDLPSFRRDLVTLYGNLGGRTPEVLHRKKQKAASKTR